MSRTAAANSRLGPTELKKKKGKKKPYVSKVLSRRAKQTFSLLFFLQRTVSSFLHSNNHAREKDRVNTPGIESAIIRARARNCNSAPFFGVQTFHDSPVQIDSVSVILGGERRKRIVPAIDGCIRIVLQVRDWLEICIANIVAIECKKRSGLNCQSNNVSVDLIINVPGWPEAFVDSQKTI